MKRDKGKSACIARAMRSELVRGATRWCAKARHPDGYRALESEDEGGKNGQRGQGGQGGQRGDGDQGGESAPAERYSVISPSNTVTAGPVR